MKCLYFLQEECELDTGLQFELYTWGPFDAKVLASIEELKQARVIIEEEPPLERRELGYKYELTSPVVQDVLTQEQAAKLDELLSLRADVLEAMSTLHFARKQLQSRDRELVVQRVKNLKPYFRLADLRSYWDKLEVWGWV